MAEKTSNTTISLPTHLKKELKQMGEETGLSVNHLVKLASSSLVANYREKGSFIFADLLNPEHRETNKNRFK